MMLAPANSVESDINFNEDSQPWPKLPVLGVIEFDVGVDLYADFIGAGLEVRRDDLASRFRDDILHPVHGIRCIIYGTAAKRLIVLDSDQLDMYGICECISYQDQEYNTF